MHFPSLPGLLVALIAGLLLFGTKRLSEMGASLGQGIREVNKSLHEIGDAADIESPTSGPSAPDIRRSLVRTPRRRRSRDGLHHQPHQMRKG